MKPVARISTRGYYNLLNGKTIKNNSYYLYPKQNFKKLIAVSYTHLTLPTKA